MSALDLVTRGLQQASGLSLTSEGLLIVQEVQPAPGIDVGDERKYDIRLVFPGVDRLTLPPGIPATTETGFGGLIQLLLFGMHQQQQLGAAEVEHDVRIVDGDLESEPTLRTAVLLSLFLDRRATEEELEAFGLEADDPRGWWGDGFPVLEGDEYGSKLWLLQRAKQTERTRVLAEGFAREALAWLLEDEIAERIEVDAVYPRRELLGLGVEIVKPANPSERFGFVWGL